MSSAMGRQIIHKLSKDTIEKVQKYREIPFERFSNWIEAGSGNYEKTRSDGRYRDNCNTLNKDISCKDHPEHKKKIHWHCGKLDCITCFIMGSSAKARKINQRLLGFQKEAYRAGVKSGRIIHFSLSINRELARKVMEDYDGSFLKFRRDKIYPMLEDMGVFAGVIFTHIRSGVCENCGQKIKDCRCEDKKLYRKFNAHFHIVGFGYIINAKKFRKKYPEFVYRNFERRYDAYQTVFYILSKTSLWRKRDGKLKPAYSYFNGLSFRKLKVVRERIIIRTENCQECGKPLTINKSDYPREVGKIYCYKIIEREFRILDIEGLRELSKRNIARYREDRRAREKEQKEGNGYG
jgi:hypothetical protein